MKCMILKHVSETLRIQADGRLDGFLIRNAARIASRYGSPKDHHPRRALVGGLASRRHAMSSGGIPLRLEGANKCDANQRWVWGSRVGARLGARLEAMFPQRLARPSQALPDKECAAAIHCRLSELGRSKVTCTSWWRRLTSVSSYRRSANQRTCRRRDAVRMLRSSSGRSMMPRARP